MAPTKINEFLNEGDEKYIAQKVQKMLYFWPRKLKKNSRRDYKKKITLGYRILQARPNESLSKDKLAERFEEAYKLLGSQKPKYQKDIFSKIMAFEKFKENEPTQDYPIGSEDEEEKPSSKKELAWKQLKTDVLRAAYKEFTNKYEDDAGDELELPSIVQNAIDAST